MLYFLLRMVLKKISLFQAYNLVCASTNEISSVGIQVGASPASWKCSEEFFSNQIKSRDPLKLGFVSNIIYFVVISMPFCYLYASYYKYFAHQFFFHNGCRFPNILALRLVRHLLLWDPVSCHCNY
jgi:hypothetical protein